MVNFVNAIAGALLGFVEGATEFVPVSSSGHLIIVRGLIEHYLGAATLFLEHNALAFDAVLQLAAILGVILYFWKDIWALVVTFFKWTLKVGDGVTLPADRAMVAALIVGTIPAVIAGLLLEPLMEGFFREPLIVAFALLAGSALMYTAERSYAKRAAHAAIMPGISRATADAAADAAATESMAVTWKKGLTIGLYQMLALVPGISRSGATISGGLLLGLSRSEAARFSFILSIPIIVGSGAKKLLELVGLMKSGAVAIGDIAWPLGVGALFAFCVGLISISVLMRYLRHHSMNVFIWYRVALAVVIVVLATL